MHINFDNINIVLILLTIILYIKKTKNTLILLVERTTRNYLISDGIIIEVMNSHRNRLFSMDNSVGYSSVEICYLRPNSVENKLAQIAPVFR